MTSDGLLRQLRKRNCFIIAHYYKDGLIKGRWTTQKGALAALGVSQAELSLALNVAALPAGVIGLFESPTGVTPYSVRVIREVIARDGLQTVLQRIDEHVAAGRKLSARAVLATINGQGSVSRRALRCFGNPENKVLKKPLDSPRTISDKYHVGVIRGEWTSYSGCARALDISRKNIRDAVHIMALWGSLPVRISEAELTFTVGRKFPALDRELGRQAFLQCMRTLRPGVRDATAETVLRELNGQNVQPSDLSRIRIRKGRGTRRLIIECSDAGALFGYRRDLERAIRSVMKKVSVSPEYIEAERLISNDPSFKGVLLHGSTR